MAGIRVDDSTKEILGARKAALEKATGIQWTWDQFLLFMAGKMHTETAIEKK